MSAKNVIKIVITLFISLGFVQMSNQSLTAASEYTEEIGKESSFNDLEIDLDCLIDYFYNSESELVALLIRSLVPTIEQINPKITHPFEVHSPPPECLV